MASTALLKLICVVLLCMIVAAPQGEARVPVDLFCVADVAPKIFPCSAYLIFGGKPSSDCCLGVKQLKDLADSRDKRRHVCRCLKESNDFPLFKNTFVAKLPELCRVNLGFQISKNTNCGTLK
ncbi:hypothetical protein Ancab_011032 [Ancistrocladus abbreviatus]